MAAMNDVSGTSSVTASDSGDSSDVVADGPILIAKLAVSKIQFF